MRRREFITGIVGSATAWPLAARAQQGEHMRRIGVLMTTTAEDQEGQARLAALRQGLQKLGWAEDRNLRIDCRWASDDVKLMRSYAEELVATKSEVIVATSNPALAMAREVTRAIPIVFVTVADPVGNGFIESLAQPGGNITGFTNFETSMGGKWLELLKEIAPSVARVGVLYQPETPTNVAFLRNVEATAPALGVKVVAFGVHDAAEIERAIIAVAAEANSGLIAIPNPVMTTNREKISSLAIERRLPAVYAFRYYAASGGLMSYGIDARDQFRQCGSYIDRILKGEKPADLPVQAPNKFELVINLKAAKAIGLSVPPTMLTRADEVIE